MNHLLVKQEFVSCCFEPCQPTTYQGLRETGVKKTLRGQSTTGPVAGLTCMPKDLCIFLFHIRANLTRYDLCGQPRHSQHGWYSNFNVKSRKTYPASPGLCLQVQLQGGFSGLGTLGCCSFALCHLQEKGAVKRGR